MKKSSESGSSSSDFLIKIKTDEFLTGYLDKIVFRDYILHPNGRCLILILKVVTFLSSPGT